MGAEPRNVGSVTEEDKASAAIDGAFAFLREVHDKPHLLDDYPEEGTIVFRTVNIVGHVFDLTAVRAPNSGEWVARPFRYSLTAGAHVLQRPIVDDGGMLHDQVAIVQTFREAGDTREAALDALESRLRSAVTEAAGIGPDNTNRGRG